MNIMIELKRCLSFGQAAGRDAQLICGGNLIEDNNIIISPIIHFNESFRSQLLLQKSPTSTIVISSPLCIYTEVIFQVKVSEAMWLQSIHIDLKKWEFSIRAYKGSPIPVEYAILLLSSLGILKSGKVLNLHTLASKKQPISTEPSKK